VTDAIHTARTELPEGTRVRLTESVERFPHFRVGAGGLGTVTENDPANTLCVKMDDPIPGCEDWDNEIVWSQEDESDFDRPPLERV
jgi:hypothetical protein